MKYLLISIFLAGANPKDTDPIKFIGNEFNRRKKSSRGKDNDNINSSSSSSSTNLKRKLDCTQYFSLERLLCIYIQVIRNNNNNHTNSDVMHEYGDISLYTNVSGDI